MENIRLGAIYPAELWLCEEKGVEGGRPGHLKSPPLFLKLVNDYSYYKSSLEVTILIPKWKIKTPGWSEVLTAMAHARLSVLGTREAYVTAFTLGRGKNYFHT